MQTDRLNDTAESLSLRAAKWGRIPGTWGDICCAVKRRYCSLLWCRVWAFRGWSADGVHWERKGRRSEEFQHTRPFRWKSLSCGASQGLHSSPSARGTFFSVASALLPSDTAYRQRSRERLDEYTKMEEKTHNRLWVPGCAPEKRLQIQADPIKSSQVSAARRLSRRLSDSVFWKFLSLLVKQLSRKWKLFGANLPKQHPDD